MCQDSEFVFYELTEILFCKSVDVKDRIHPYTVISGFCSRSKADGIGTRDLMSTKLIISHGYIVTYHVYT